MSGQKDVDKHRVRISHKVEESGTIRDVEIPWTMGVLMDGYGNHPDSEKTSLYDASFTDVSSNNFERVLSEAKPRMQINVNNHFSDDPDEQLVADIEIKSMKDFEPDAISSKVPGLKEAYETRVKLEGLLRHLESSRPAKLKLDELFDGSDGNSGALAEGLEKLLAEVGTQDSDAAVKGDAE